MPEANKFTEHLVNHDQFLSPSPQIIPNEAEAKAITKSRVRMLVGDSALTSHMIDNTKPKTIVRPCSAPFA